LSCHQDDRIGALAERRRTAGERPAARDHRGPPPGNTYTPSVEHGFNGSSDFPKFPLLGDRMVIAASAYHGDLTCAP
jgi:hypothetical protein